MSSTFWRLTAAVCFVCAAAVASMTAAAAVVARVGERAITEEQVRAEIVRLRQTDDIGDALRTLSAAGRRQIVDGLVRRELMTLGAGRAGYATRPDVQAAIARATAEIVAEAYRRDELAKADVSDAALRAYYDAHLAEFQPAARVRARHIVTADRASADAVRAALAAGADFAQLARERSLDPFTRDKGGALGWIPRGVMVKPFEDALFALRVGDTSAPIESSKGVHVIQVEEVDQPLPRSFESVRGALVDAVRGEHLAALHERLRTEFPVTLYPDALKALER
jgi:peptidyl-prolyl cis-trans isomerase C